jgi:hypothetical protein
MLITKKLLTHEASYKRTWGVPACRSAAAMPAPAKPWLEFIALRAHNGSVLRSRGHASNRTNPRGQTVLLSPLRSTVFSDGLAASQG